MLTRVVAMCSLGVVMMGSFVAMPAEAASTTSCAGTKSEHPEGRIVYAGRESNFRDFEIYVMDGDGGNPTRLTYNDVDDIRPDWSPSGNRIVWVRDQRGTQDSLDRDLYIMCADGSDKRKRAFVDKSGYSYLNTRYSNEDYPAWRPTGGWIAFEWDPANDGSDTRVMRPGRAVNRTIVAQQENTFNSDPAWSPDGNKIALIEDKWTLGITRPCCGGLRRLFTSDFGGLLNPAWSPDGSEIMVSIGSGSPYDEDMPEGNMDIYAVDPKEGTALPMFVEPGSSIGGDYSSDGSRIIFYSGALLSWHIWVVDRNGTGLAQLTSGEGAEINPSWTD